jgi:hypothetical protein
MSPEPYVMVPKAVIDRVRGSLTGDLLHDLESSTHVTDLLPLDAVPEGMTAREFGDRFLDTAALAADRAGLVMASVAAEVEWEDGSVHLGNRASVTQLGTGAYARAAVADLTRDFAASIH